jgi:hypothetical protein
MRIEFVGTGTIGEVPGCVLVGLVARTVELTGALCFGDRTAKSRRAT